MVPKLLTLTLQKSWLQFSKDLAPSFGKIKHFFAMSAHHTISARQLLISCGNFKVCSKEREVFWCSNHRALIEVTDLESVCKQAVLSTGPRNMTQVSTSERHSSLFRTCFEFAATNWRRVKIYFTKNKDFCFTSFISAQKTESWGLWLFENKSIFCSRRYWSSQNVWSRLKLRILKVFSATAFGQ